MLPPFHGISVFLFLLFLLTACSEGSKESVESNAALPSQRRREVVTYTVQMEPVTESIRLNGQVEYNPNQVVRYASLVNGIITKTYFSLGDKVTKGQVLAELRSAELVDLNAQSKTLASQLNVAKRKLAVAQSLFGDRIASEKDLAEAQSEVDILKNEIEKVSANLSLYNASDERGVFQIIAPVSGYVVENTISAGTPITSNDSGLFTISNLSDVWVTTNVYAVDLPFVQKGMTAEIKSKAYPDETFEGMISEISQVFDPNERVLKARILMTNRDLKLKPGLTIEAVVKKKSKKEAIGVPSGALIFHNNANYLLVQKPDGSLERRKLTIVAKDSDRVFIKSGISAGEKVVVADQLLLFSETGNSGN